MYYSPRFFKFLLNIYGPYLGAGVTIEEIAEDWRYMRVSMKLRWYNRNAMGVHFGGSIYSMIDPHLVLMHMQLLGSDYLVWDQSATIEFLRPGTGKLSADFHLTDDEIDTIKEKADNGATCRPEYHLKIVNQKNKTVARVIKKLYVKKKEKDIGNG